MVTVIECVSADGVASCSPSSGENYLFLVTVIGWIDKVLGLEWLARNFDKWAYSSMCQEC